MTPLPSASAFLNATSGLIPCFSITLSSFRISMSASLPFIGMTALAVAGLDLLEFKLAEFGTVFIDLSILSSKVLTKVALVTISRPAPNEAQAASIKAASTLVKNFLKLSIIRWFSALSAFGSHAELKT